MATNEPIERKPVDSKAVATVGYHAASETLEVEWKSGPVWRYDDVPPDEVDRLLNADSIGRYMKVIKLNYVGTKQTDGTQESPDGTPGAAASPGRPLQRTGAVRSGSGDNGMDAGSLHSRGLTAVQ